jgi:cytochrome oxidase Cu insertion factor (SCO1/SenC/PrrC family)
MERIIWIPVAVAAAAVIGFAVGLNVGRATVHTTTIVVHDQPIAKERGAGHFGP